MSATLARQYFVMMQTADNRFAGFLRYTTPYEYEYKLEKYQSMGLSPMGNIIKPGVVHFEPSYR